MERLIRENTPYGVIATNCVTPEQEERLSLLLDRFQVPTVLIAAVRPGTTSIRGDNGTGMRALMCHLLDEL